MRLRPTFFPPLPSLTALTLIALSLALTATLRAQTSLTPPAQTHVAAIGAAPFKAPATADFAPGASFTLEGWFYLTGSQPFGWLMGKGLATGGTDPFLSFGLLMNDDGTRVRFSVSTGAAGSGRDVTAPSAFPLRTWTHVAAVLDGTTMRLLLNGTVVATGTAGGAPLSAPAIPFGVGIAYLANGNTNFPGFPGLARQVRTWSTARTPAQILAGASVALPADRTGLVAAWPLDESSGATARDLSGANRPLTASSGSLTATRLVLLEAGPFFSVTTSTPPNNALVNTTDGELIDFDSDGDLDLIATRLQWPPTFPETRVELRALRNTNGTFTDVTAQVLGSVTMVHPRHSIVLDLNGDGRMDLVIIGHGTDMPPFPGEQSKLFIQSADGRLVDETATRLPARIDFTHNIAAADIDGDGDVDLYMANVNGGPATLGPVFYLNNGSGVFSIATGRLPADIANRTNGKNYTAALFLDVNADGRPDLVLGPGDTGPNEILLNDGAGRFARDARYALPTKILGANATTVAIASGDLNNDGAPDLIMATTGGSIVMPSGEIVYGYAIPGLQLLLNRGDGTFYDASERLNVTFGPNDRWVKWVRILDVNADGKLDLVLNGASEGGRFSRSILLNRGAATFVDASEAFAGPVPAAFFSAADLNRDGLVDLVGLESNLVVVARGLKPLDRALFLSTPDAPGRLANLSVRTQAGTGDQTLITGFALGGAGTKPLLVRAVGPTLSAFGLADTLPDPFVEIAPLNAAKVTENNNWSGTATLKNAFASVGAFPLATDTSLDAALVFAPGAGAYTAKISDTASRPGLALVEIYDTGTTNTPKLTNVSARTQVGIDADALIVGFVVSGNVPKKFLIRAVGPTLGAFGVGGTLVDPLLDVRPLGSETIVATNDDWRGTAALKAAFTSVGAFALATDTSRDAALAIELPPGAYTATVSGKARTTGVALVEVYELP